MNIAAPLATLAVVLVVACGGESASGYPEWAAEQYSQGCSLEEQSCRCSWEGLQERIPWNGYKRWYIDGELHGGNQEKGIPATPDRARLNRISNEVNNDCQDNVLNGKNTLRS